MTTPQKRSETAKKAWVTRRRNAAAAGGNAYQGTANVKKQKVKNSEAAKEAWDTRRRDDSNAEEERQEALRILEEMGKAHEQQKENDDAGSTGSQGGNG